jgi:hypothetical protein
MLFVTRPIGWGVIPTDGEEKSSGVATQLRPAAISFITTEHFTLQGARSSTIAESTGRASMFLTSVSGGLVAFGLVATATGVGGAFYAFGLVLLPTLAFVGLVTFERTLQSGLQDFEYARRITQLRAYYFDNAPELAPYLLSVRPEHEFKAEGVRGRSFHAQGFRTVAGMVGVITAVLLGAEAGLAVTAAVDVPAAALASGVIIGLAALFALMRYQWRVWADEVAAPIFEDERVQPEHAASPR